MNEGEVVGSAIERMTRSLRKKLVKAEREAEFAADQRADLLARVMLHARVQLKYVMPDATGEPESKYQVARRMELESLRNRWPDSAAKVWDLERQAQELRERFCAMELQKKKKDKKKVIYQAGV